MSSPTFEEMVKVIAQAGLWKFNDQYATEEQVREFYIRQDQLAEKYRQTGPQIEVDYIQAKTILEDKKCPERNLVPTGKEPDVTPFTVYTEHKCTKCGCIREKREVFADD